jgi:hypothetical protein
LRALLSGYIYSGFAVAVQANAPAAQRLKAK